MWLSLIESFNHPIFVGGGLVSTVSQRAGTFTLSLMQIRRGKGKMFLMMAMDAGAEVTPGQLRMVEKPTPCRMPADDFYYMCMMPDQVLVVLKQETNGRWRCLTGAGLATFFEPALIAYTRIVKI